MSLALRTASPWRSLAVVRALAWAVIGVVAGHVITYELLFPDSHDRASLLAETGHGWLGLVAPMAIVGLLAALVATLMEQGGGRPRSVRFAALASIQVGAFVGLELGERFAAGITPDLLGHQLTHDALLQILLVGCLIQLLCAWLGAWADRVVASMATPSAPSMVRAPGPRFAAAVTARRLVRRPVRPRSRAPPPRDRCLPIFIQHPGNGGSSTCIDVLSGAPWSRHPSPPPPSC